MNKWLSLPAILFALVTVPAFGDWVETDAEGGRYFYSAGKWKEVPADTPIWSAIDLATATLLLVHSEQKVYAQGTLDEYCLTAAAFVKKMLSEMPPELRTEAEQMLQAPLMSKGVPQVSVAEAASGEKIAGFDTEKYEVRVNAELYEELWLAVDAPVLQEIDADAVRRLQGKLAGCTEAMAPALEAVWEQHPEQTAAYDELIGKGWPMRSILYENDAPIAETLVSTLERTNIPDTEFQPPKGFRQVPFEQFMLSDD